MPAQTKFCFVPGCANNSSPLRLRSSAPLVLSSAIMLFPAILRRVANPVQPFGFSFVQDRPPLSLLDGIRDGFGKQADLLDQSDEGWVNKI